MPTNIEIKARARDAARQFILAEELADGPAVVFRQEDIFFRTQRGRLKLRLLAPDRGELICYEREDKRGPKSSHYSIYTTRDPETLRMVLAATLDTIGTVNKTRRLYRCGQTRIHCDEVARLGAFLELEVVLREGQTAEEAEAIIADLLEKLEIRDEDLVQTAYRDLLGSAADIAAEADS
jgi:predicted adenylyl cyclase CyaB